MREDLHEACAALGLLAPLVQLVEAGLWRPKPGSVKRWRAAVKRVDEATEDGRDFWDDYVRNVKGALRLLERDRE